MKLLHAILKEDPLQKQLRLRNLTTDSLKEESIASCLQIYRKCNNKQEQNFVKVIVKHLEDKGTATKKIKIMMLIIEIAKTSNFDVTDLILGKKIKLFIRPRKFSHGEIEPTPDRLEEYILEELLVPLYNYQMKLWTNEELYINCRSGEIPNDDVYRRGTKIRFIWIFKLYNIINSLLPIVESIVKLQKMNPDLAFFHQCGAILFNDLSMMNNFAIKALEQASEDNFILMPYFDMLQFYQSLKEQLRMGASVIKAYEGILEFSHGLVLPMQLAIAQEELHEIEIQALRVKLISNALKNPKKDHTVLETEYNQKRKLKESFSMKSMPTVFTEPDEDFKEKWRRLDM